MSDQGTGFDVPDPEAIGGFSGGSFHGGSDSNPSWEDIDATLRNFSKAGESVAGFFVPSGVSGGVFAFLFPLSVQVVCSCESDCE